MQGGNTLKVLCCLLLLHKCSAKTKQKRGGRIIGGTETTIDEFPYQLSYQEWKKHSCGAAIISKDWAITAAHCVDGTNVTDMTLRAGSSDKTSGGTVHKAEKAIAHELYDPKHAINDIAVIKVSPPFQLSNKVKTIDLETSEVGEGTMAKVSGWGRTAEKGSSPNKLRQVGVPVLGFDECQKRYRSKVSKDQNICAGFSMGGKDSCRGDSGGPLVADGKLIGIVSWGVGCAKPNAPGVYTKVSAFREWIKEKTGV